MAEILESWESDEAQDWESEEGTAESEESAEDIGEAARRSSRARGVRGIKWRGQSVSFPSSLAKTSELNRGVSMLEGRLQRLERSRLAQQKSDVSAAGLVTLAIGGGLTLWAVGKTLEAGFTFNGLAGQDTMGIAAVVSATQLATKAALLATARHYPSSSKIGVTADIFAATQLAVYAFGSWYSPTSGWIFAQPPTVLDRADLQTDATLQKLKPNEIVVTRDTHETVQVIADPTTNRNTYRVIEGGFERKTA